MSGKQQGMVFDLDLPHEQLWVLSALGDNADDDGGKCFPTVARIAWKCNHSVRTVQRILQRLREAGIIEAVAFENGGARPTEYQLHLERAPKKTPFEAMVHGRSALPVPFDTGDSLSPVSDEQIGVTDRAIGVTDREKTGDRAESISADDPSVDPSRDPSSDPPTRRARARGGEITPEQIMAKANEWAWKFGGFASARAEIDRALLYEREGGKAHSARFVHNWLTRARVGRSRPAPPPTVKPPTEIQDYARDFNASRMAYFHKQQADKRGEAVPA